jgi:predicted PolB exonuclease-like 3'-5' exonuclease
MKTHPNLEHILFLDIETVPEVNSYAVLNPKAQELFAAKTAYEREKEHISAEAFYPRAGIWAEFGKIICISVGYLTSTGKKRQFRVRSFSGDEKKLLLDFRKLLDTYFSKSHHRLCAHNGKEFDFPFIARRILKYQLELPEVLQLMGKKPWEVPHIDTLEIW